MEVYGHLNTENLILFHIGNNKTMDRIKGIKGDPSKYREIQDWLRSQGGNDVDEYPDRWYLHDDLVYFVVDGKVRMCEENDLPAQLLEITKLPLWRADMYDEYYYISEFNVCKAVDTREGIDDRRYEFGNYFRTRENAMVYKNKIVAEVEKILKR